MERKAVMIEEIYNNLLSLENAIKGDDEENFDLFLVGTGGKSENSEVLNDLNRLLYSLEIFKKREAGLYSILFLGFFSAGKSSTINSILDLWQSEKKRPIGNTSTDTDVTILSHIDSAIRNHYQTKHTGISVVVNSIDHDLLKEAVVIDTPGSGEFANDVENLKEYMFWSDLIIFCSNSNSTLGLNDIEVLKAKEEFLPSIPLIFGFTKVDDVFSSISTEKGCSGFNKEKYNEKLSNAILKLNKKIPGHKYNEDDFLPLVTRDKIQWGIKELIEKIEAYRKSTDQAISEKIMEDRFSAFLKRAKSYKNFFADFGKNEIRTINNHFKELHENRKKCDRMADFNDSPIGSELEDRIQRIEEGHEKFLWKLSPIGYSNWPQRFSFSEPGIKKLCEQRNKTELRYIKEKLSNKLSEMFNNEENNFENISSEKILHEIEIILKKECKIQKQLDHKFEFSNLESCKNSILSEISSLDRKTRKYLPILLRDTNEKIKQKVQEEARKFQKSLKTFTKAAAVLGELRVFNNPVILKHIEEMILKVNSDTKTNLPDIASNLIDINHFNEAYENLHKLLNSDLEKIIKNIKEINIPTLRLSTDINLFILDQNGLPEGYDSVSASDHYSSYKKNLNVEDDLTLKTLSFKKMFKILNCTAPVAMFIILLFAGREDVIEIFSSGNGVIDSIIAYFMVNGAGIIATAIAFVIYFIFQYFSIELKKLKNKAQNKNYRKLSKFVKNEFIDQIFKKIEARQMTILIDSLEDKNFNNIVELNNSLLSLKISNEEAEKCLNQFIEEVTKLKDNVIKKLDPDLWCSMLSEFANKEKDERIDELYFYMDKLVKKAEKRVNVVKKLIFS
jgi:hypothetical protein